MACQRRKSNDERMHYGCGRVAFADTLRHANHVSRTRGSNIRLLILARSTHAIANSVLDGVCETSPSRHTLRDSNSEPSELANIPTRNLPFLFLFGPLNERR